MWAGKVLEGEAGGMVPLCFTGRYATFSDWPEDWLRPALEDALRSPVPVLIDCPVDYRENDHLVEA